MPDRVSRLGPLPSGAFFLDMRNWSAPIWQAFVEVQAPFEKRRWIVENMLPPEWRDRVVDHLKTVVGLRKRNKK